MNKVLASLVSVVALTASAEAALLPPEVGVGWENGWVKEWRKEIPGLEISDRRSPAGGNFERVVRSWTWRGKAPLEKVTLSVRYHVEGDPKALKPFVPGVLLYGNPSNRNIKDGQVPVYNGTQGEFAIFEEHRLPVPFVLLEDSQSRNFAALHPLPASIPGAVKRDLWWSAGVEAADGGADIVLLSGPVGYNRRRSTVKGIPYSGGWLKYDEAYITLKPGQTVEKMFFIQTGKATDDAYGFQQALCRSLDLFPPELALVREAPLKEIIAVKRNYARGRWCEDPKSGMCGFDAYGGCGGRVKHQAITLGWCGCSESCSYALAVLDGDPSDREKAQRSLDALAEGFGKFTKWDGAFPLSYPIGGNGLSKNFRTDPVSCGMVLDTVMRAIVYARKHPERGLKPEKWMAFAKQSLDNIAACVTGPYWRAPVCSGEGYLIAPLVMGSEVFGEPKQLAAAERMAAKIAEAYVGYERIYWGGTLDAHCEDKEGAMASFLGFEELLRHAVRKGDKAAEAKYARLARHALDVELTYLQIWDVPMPLGSDLQLRGFRSTGWTVVSPQNQCLDAFAIYSTPAIWRLGDYLKDERLKTLAKLMYASPFQLTDAAGSLGEQIQQTNYGHMLDNHHHPGPDADASSFRGVYRSTWTMLWLTAHFLRAGAEFTEMKVDW